MDGVKTWGRPVRRKKQLWRNGNGFDRVGVVVILDTHSADCNGWAQIGPEGSGSEYEFEEWDKASHSGQQRKER